MDYRKMYIEMGISKEVVDYSESVLKTLEERFKRIDEIAELNQMKVLAALQKAGICFSNKKLVIRFTRLWISP